MGPEDYLKNQQQAGGQRLPSFAPDAGTVAQPDPSWQVQESPPPIPQGDLVRIYERLSQFHARICSQRDSLQNVNQRVGTRHIPQSGSDKVSPPEPPQREGILPAIESFLDLMYDALKQVDYEIERINLL